MKGRLVSIITTKLIDGGLTSINIVMNYAPTRNVVIKSAIILIIKFNRFIIRADINQNFVSLTLIKIKDAIINNFVLLLIVNPKSKFK
jgi:hypothetical protein